MTVSFKLNNAGFLPLSFPNFSESCSSVPDATACNFLSDNVSLSSKHLPSSSNKLVSSVSTQSHHHLVCNFVMSLKPVPVNVSFAPMHVRVNVV